MKELKIDKMTNDLIIFASDRNKRPIDKIKQSHDDEIVNEYEENCPFCRGNEKYTSEPLFELRDNDGWIVKSVNNKFPIIDEDSTEIFGIHEVMVDSYRHNANFYDMSLDEFNALFSMYKDRYNALIKGKNILYINIFKNFMRKAGASLMHPHSQIMSMSVIPPEVKNEINIAKEYFEANSKSLYSNIIKGEISFGERVIYSGKFFLAFVPDATKFSGEVRIMFKDNVKLKNLDEKQIKELSYIYKNLFQKIYGLYGSMPFNVCVHTIPKNMDIGYCFNEHMHIIPRRYNFGGFELGADMHVSSIDARYLAKELKF